MKVVLLGIAVILFGIAIISAYSSTGFGYSSGTRIGLGISFLGLMMTIVGCITKQKK